MKAPLAAGRSFLALTTGDAVLVALLTSAHRVQPGASTTPVEPGAFPKLNFHILGPGGGDEAEHVRLRAEIRAWKAGPNGGPGALEAIDEQLSTLCNEVLVFAFGWRLHFQVGGLLPISAGSADVLARARDLTVHASPWESHPAVAGEVIVITMDSE